MIIYDGLDSDFLDSVDNDTIAMEIEKNILEKMGRHTPEMPILSAFPGVFQNSVSLSDFFIRTKQ